MENKFLLLKKDRTVTKFNDMAVKRDNLAGEISCLDKEFEATLALKERVEISQKFAII